MIYSLVLHGIILVLVFVGVGIGVHTVTDKAPGTGDDSQPIKATVVSEELVEKQLSKIQAAKANRREARQAAAQKREALQESLQQKRAKLAALRRKRQAAKEALAEARAKAEQAREKASSIKKQARKEAARQAAKAKAAAQRKKALQQEIAEELSRRQKAAAHSEAMGSYRAAIRQQVVRNWTVPPGTPRDLQCDVKVRQVRGGVVVEATIGSCNAGKAVKQSIRSAVYKASPLPKPADSSLFREQIIFTFTYEDVGGNHQ